MSLHASLWQQVPFDGCTCSASMPVTGSQRLSVQPFTRAAPPCRQARNAVKRHRCVLARAGGDDDEFEAKLKQLEKGQAKSSPRGKKNSTSKKRDSKQDDSKSGVHTFVQLACTCVCMRTCRVGMVHICNVCTSL